MAIYRMAEDKESLTRIADTSFGEEGVLEREDLQRILRDQPDILEPGLFVITEEFRDWADSNRRIDLLCLDAGGRLVVVELKRGDTGEHMDLQSIRYAAMVSTITLQQAINAHQDYLDKRGIDANAAERVHGHLENLDDSQGFSTAKPRIVLVSEGFSPELTTSVLWLNSNGLDIACIRMQPYRNRAEILVETSQVIPLPEAADYFVRIRERENEVQKQRTDSSKPVPGSEVFAEHIQDARPEFHQELNRLYAWAVDLREREAAELESNPGKTRTTLGITPSGKGKRLVTLWNNRQRNPDLTFSWNVLREFAPEAAALAKPLVDAHSGASQTEAGSVNISGPISDNLLAILREAYREANGLPGDGDEGGDGE